MIDSQEEQQEPGGPFGTGQDDLDLAFILQHVGFGLIGLFLAFMLKLIWPVAVLDPVWHITLASALRTTALFPLLAALLLLLAGRLSDPERSRPNRLLWVRRGGFLAACGFLLLIPLQIRAGLLVLGAGHASEVASLSQVKQVAQEIRAAGSEAALRLALSRLPGAPPEIPGRFTKPLDQVRSVVLNQLQPQIQRADARLAALHQERLNAGLKGWITDGLAALSIAVCFAAFGSLTATSPPLLLFVLAVPGLLLEAVGQPGLRRRRDRASHDAAWMDTINMDGPAGDADNDPIP